MRNFRTALLAGVAAAAIVGAAGIAAAQSPNGHVLTVPLPGGGVEQIFYTGSVAPQVYLSRAPAAVLMPSLTPAFGPDSPFAMFDRISAEMDREMAAMFRQAEALTAAAQYSPSQATEAAMRSLPPGTASFSSISTFSGNGMCSQSVEITAPGNGAAPKVVRHSSGNCGAGANAPWNIGVNTGGSVALPPAPAPSNRPDALWVQNQGQPDHAVLVRPATWQQR